MKSMVVWVVVGGERARRTVRRRFQGDNSPRTRGVRRQGAASIMTRIVGIGPKAVSAHSAQQVEAARAWKRGVRMETGCFGPPGSGHNSLPHTCPVCTVLSLSEGPRWR